MSPEFASGAEFAEFASGGFSSAGPAFRYTGQVQLAGISLYYYKARMYDPVLGRFLQTDPSGYAAGMNLYAYVESDPANRSDPSGLDDIETVISTGVRSLCTDFPYLCTTIIVLPKLLPGADVIGPLSQAANNNLSSPAGQACMAAGVGIGASAGGIIGYGGGAVVGFGGGAAAAAGTGGLGAVAVPAATAGGAAGGAVVGSAVGGGAGFLGGTVVCSVASGSGGSGSGDARKINPPKGESPIWKGLKRFKGDVKTDGKNFYKWDSLHNDIEVYSRQGKHLGSKDPVTGEMYKPAVPGRRM